MMARLEEICAINMGQSPDSSTYNEDGNGLPFFQGNADFGEIYPAVRMWCSEPTKIAREKDILISVRAPIGALNIANCECCIGRGLAALTVNEDICAQEYLWHALSGKVDELNSKGTGSTFKAINKKTLSETEIPLPPIDEQRKIAAILDKVSDLIAKRQQQLDKLDEMIKARFMEIFGDSETNTKNWRVLPMSKICSVGSSKRIYQSEQSSSGVPFWRISDLTSLITTGTVTPELYIPEERYKELKTQGQVPAPGDILITSRGTLGQCYIVKVNDRFYFQDGMISWLSGYMDGVTPLYISYLFTMPGFRKQIDSMQAGSTVAYLSITMIKKLKVMLPDIESQQQFASFVSKTEKTKTTISRSLEKLETLKKALMQEYFG
ncbi:restriction endonuclease subunit S [Ruminococcus sp. AM42-11]|uniref:restriction endonuclease subunit S n=1 Tax=Ruminococcus sp. AM42-11 TaxID=2292372 RepID=UPI001FA94347|nr:MULTISPECIES: restriction endonuclease subunit S [Eubacteriales]